MKHLKGFNIIVNENTAMSQNPEYIIINKTAIQKRIEELKKEYILLSDKSDRSLSDIEDEREIIGEQRGLATILSQSTPLIPEIEKAFNAGIDSEILSVDAPNLHEMGLMSKRDYDNYYDVTPGIYQPPTVKEYISNLKLDI